MPSSENQIKTYLHCALCVKEGNLSSLATTVGWTDDGLQVWCEKHECNIVNIDFEGAQHPANTGREA